ncbi:Plasma kallikrein [Mycoemilia scoparia]|uniref:Plasma kallikrein n=1 Tax=Mycoemilia scoparia TaxID=417184 RepID=A0A9W8DS34_9FUNG|nr:Plasma kallikrein [Mycoemilia scoparia]
MAVSAAPAVRDTQPKEGKQQQQQPKVENDAQAAPDKQGPEGNERIVNNQPVVGGQPAGSGQFPFAVFIQISLGETRSAVCAGSILSREWIVTAGHCLVSSPKDVTASNPISPKNVVVYVGSSNVYAAKPYKAKQVVVNPQLDIVENNYDIGLIKLGTKLKFGSDVQPIAIYDGQIGSGVPVKALGWGQTSNVIAGASQNLMQVTLTTGSYAQCRAIRAPFTSHNGDVICVPTPDGRDSCYGDSGGPLVVSQDTFVRTNKRQIVEDNDRSSTDSRWLLAGVTSYGDTLSGRPHPPCGSRDGAGFYTHVAYYIDFITKATGLKKEDITSSGRESSAANKMMVAASEKIVRKVETSGARSLIERRGAWASLPMVAYVSAISLLIFLYN